MLSLFHKDAYPQMYPNAVIPTEQSERRTLFIEQTGLRLTAFHYSRPHSYIDTTINDIFAYSRFLMFISEMLYQYFY